MLPKKVNLHLAIDGGSFHPEFNVVTSGIERLLTEFIKELIKNENYKIKINYYYFGKEYKSRSRELIKYTHLQERLYGSISLPKAVMNDKNDAFLSFSSNIPLLLRLVRIKKYAFFYDLGFVTYPSFYKNADRLEKMITRSLKIADHCFTLSNYGKREFLQKFQGHDLKLSVIYPGLDHINVKKIKRNVSQKYFLYVGVVKPIKNVELVINCFDSFLQKSEDKNYKLIIIGRHEKTYYNRLKKTKNIQFIELATDDTLYSYYKGAIALLNFSREEGFAFPVFEALQLGTSVVVNDLGVYKEFATHFRNLFITKNSREMVSQMLKLTKKPGYSYESIKIKNLFTWSKFTSALMYSIKST